MVYHGINFYPASVEGRSESEFIEAHKHQALSVAQLKEVYALIAKKNKPKKAAKEAPPSSN